MPPELAILNPIPGSGRAGWPHTKSGKTELEWSLLHPQRQRIGCKARPHTKSEAGTELEQSLLHSQAPGLAWAGQNHDYVTPETIVLHSDEGEADNAWT